MGEQRRAIAELLARIGLAVRRHQRELYAALRQRPQHRLDAREQRNLRRSLRLQPPRMPRDRRQLPQRHFEPAEDLPRRSMPQPLDILVSYAAKAEAIGDIVDGAQEPRKAVGQGAVEIEDGEGVGQRAGFASRRDVACSYSPKCEEKPCGTNGLKSTRRSWATPVIRWTRVLVALVSRELGRGYDVRGHRRTVPAALAR